MTPKQIHRLATNISKVANAAQDLLRLANEMSETEPENALTISSELQKICASNDRLSTFAMGQAETYDTKPQN